MFLKIIVGWFQQFVLRAYVFLYLQRIVIQGLIKNIPCKQILCTG